MKNTILRECLRISRAHNTEELHSEWGCFHHFSFIIQGNKIIEWATNKAGDPLITRGYPKGSKRHSESEAFRKAKGLLDRQRPFQCVNIRLIKNNGIRISKPCECCYAFLQDEGCAEVYFTTDIGYFANIKL